MQLARTYKQNPREIASKIVEELEKSDKFTNININLARGYVMTLMVFLQNFQVFNCCSEKQTIFKHNFKSNLFKQFASNEL